MIDDNSVSPELAPQLDSSGVALVAITLLAAASSDETPITFEDVIPGLQVITHKGASLPQMPTQPKAVEMPTMINPFRVDWDAMNDERCLEMTWYVPSSVWSPLGTVTDR